jgi:hypothetical protein
MCNPSVNRSSPSEHERLAAEETDRAAAWLEALQQECAQPGGSWELNQPDPDDSDATGSLDGHPAQPDYESDTDPIHGWISCDSEDETFCN